MKIENVEVYGLFESIEASGYPKQSTPKFNPEKYEYEPFPKRAFALGQAKNGSGHDCMLKGITVQFDWRKSILQERQILRYHFLDIISSQSTMHNALSMKVEEQCNEYVCQGIIGIVQAMIDGYNNNKDTLSKEELKELELEILYNLPSGYELTARFTTNYLQLKTVIGQRRQHKLPEWREFCSWALQLPYFKQLTGLEE
jgi:hypothetical protein